MSDTIVTTTPSATTTTSGQTDKAATQVASKEKSKTTSAKQEPSFENKEAANPLASQKTLTLKEKIEKRIADVEMRRAKEGKSQEKKSAVVKTESQGEDKRDADAFATPKVIRRPKAEKAPEPETPVEQPVAELDPQTIPLVETDHLVDDQLPPAWEPNFEYTYGKFDPQTGKWSDEKAEIPEEVRALIKDEKSEALVKQMWSAADGIDHIKAHRDKFKADYEGLSKYVGDVHQRLQGLEGLLQKGDLDSAFEMMGLHEEKVLKWVHDKLQYMQLEPGQRNLIDAQRDAERRARLAEQNQRAATEQAMTSMARSKAMALDAITERPDLKAVIAAYDQRPGRKPTDPTFRDLVINHGELTWHRSGGKIDLSPHEAVEAVLRDYGIAAAYGGSHSQQSQHAQSLPSSHAPAQSQRQPQQPPRQTPTLPNVASRASSPTKPVIRTKADLMKVRKQILTA